MKGLVLEGGGAKGSYQVGAYKALKELGYEFDYIVGTSIGAVNGVMFTQGDEDIAEKLWTDIKYSRVIDADDSKLNKFINEELTISNFMDKVSLVKEVISEGGFDTTPFKELLDYYVDEEKVRKSKIKFGLVTVDLTNRKPIEIFIDQIEEGKLKEYLYGSSNLPLFKQEPIDGRHLIDGGFYANNPVEMLKEKCDEIVNVLLYHNRTLRNTPESGVKVIGPREKFTDVINFTSESAIYGMNLGYYDTYKYFKGLLGNKYYVEKPGDQFAVNILIKLHEKLVRNGYYKKDLRRFLEDWLALYLRDNKLHTKLSYSEILVLMVEKLAKHLDLERFNIYTLPEMSREIKEKLNSTEIGKKYSVEYEIVELINN